MTINLRTFTQPADKLERPIQSVQSFPAPKPLVELMFTHGSWPEVLFLDGVFWSLITWDGKLSAEYEKTLGFDLNTCKEEATLTPPTETNP